MKRIYYTLLGIFLALPISVKAAWGMEAAWPSRMPKGQGSSASDSLAIAIGSIIGNILTFLGVIFLLLMIYGGVTWMTAAGDEKKVTKAKELITAAVIGLVVVLSAYALTTYLGDNVLGNL